MDNSASISAPDGPPRFAAFDPRRALRDIAEYSRIDNLRGAWSIVRQCDLTCAFPVGLSTSRYRRGHLAHHQDNGTAEDPDLQAMLSDPDGAGPSQGASACASSCSTCWACTSASF